MTKILILLLLSGCSIKITKPVHLVTPGVTYTFEKTGVYMSDEFIIYREAVRLESK